MPVDQDKTIRFDRAFDFRDDQRTGEPAFFQVRTDGNFCRSGLGLGNERFPVGTVDGNHR